MPAAAEHPPLRPHRHRRNRAAEAAQLDRPAARPSSPPLTTRPPGSPGPGVPLRDRRAGPSTRKRERAAVASFCKWAVRYDLLDASPMDRIDAIAVPGTPPQAAVAADVAAVLDAICSRATSAPGCMARAAPSEPCCWTTGSRCSGSTSPDPGTPRARCSRVHQLARGPLSYDAVHNRWKKYCAAGAAIGIHRLRHVHVTELKMGRIASDASFGTSREHALPAAQRAALRRPQPAESATRPR